MSRLFNFLLAPLGAVAAFAGTVRALLRLGPRMPPQGAALAAHFRSHGVAVQDPEILATGEQEPAWVLEFALSAAPPVVVLVYSAPPAAERNFRRLRKGSSAYLMRCNENLVMLLADWNDEATEFRHAVDAFGSLRSGINRWPAV